MNHRSAGHLPDKQKGNAMNPHTQALVHSLLASQLQIPEESIDDAHTLDALGLDPLDLVFVVLRLEQFDRGKGDFPLAALADARSVRDLVLLVDLWLQRGTTPGRLQTTGPARRSVA